MYLERKRVLLSNLLKRQILRRDVRQSWDGDDVKMIVRVNYGYFIDAEV